MSAFNETAVSELIVLLQSNKIKERNDALSKLDIFASQSSALLNRLPPSTMMSLIEATFNNIIIEKLSYVNGKSQYNHTVEERLSKASGLLRNIIMKIRDTMIKNKFKLKYYLSMLKTIVQTIMWKAEGCDRLLKPVLLNLLKVFNSLTSMSVFKSHLSSAEKHIFASSTMKVLNITFSERLRDEHDNYSGTEKVVAEALQTLLTICFDTETSTPSFINDSRANYNGKLINILSDFHMHIFSSNKKESLCLVLIFRLLNAMLINSSVNDLYFCHRLFRLGVRFFNGLKFLTFDSLKEQIAIFVNIVPSFVDLSGVPKQTGRSWELNELLELESNANVSEDDCMLLSASEEFIISSDDVLVSSKHRNEKIYINDLATFINQLFELLLGPSNDFKLSAEDVNLKVIPQNIKAELDWFNFQHFNLCNNSKASKAWLLISGLSDFLARFFSYKKKLAFKNNGNGNMLIKNSVEADSYRSGKRRKIDTSKFDSVFDYLTSSDDVVEFAFSVMMYMAHDGASVSALQVLAFIISSQARTLTISKPNFHGIFSSVVKTFELQDSALNYWSLLSLKMIILRDYDRKETTQNHEPLKSFHINQALKYALDMSKSESLSEVSCSLISTVLDINANEDVHWEIDELVSKQFDNLIQLSEINGPATISRHTFYFWFRVYDFCKSLKVRKGDSSNFICVKIQDWLLSKWDRISSLKYFEDLTLFAIFISWLSGSPDLAINISTINEPKYTCEGVLMSCCMKWRTSKELRNFVLLETEETAARSEGMAYFPETLSSSPQRVEPILNKLCKLFNDIQMFHDDGPAHKRNLYNWTMTMIHISEKIQELQAHCEGFKYQIMRVREDRFDEQRPSDIFSLMGTISSFSEASSDVLQKFLSSLKVDRFVDAALPQIMSGSSATSKAESRHSKSDSFKGFGNVKSINSSEFPSSVAHAELGIYQMKSYDFAEYHLMDFILKCGTAKGLAAHIILEQFSQIFSRLPPGQSIISCLYFFVTNEVVQRISSEKLCASPLAKIITTYAEKVLSNFEYERKELAIGIGCKLLSISAKHWCNDYNSSMKQDCSDITIFIFKLITTNAIDTEYFITSYLHLAFTVLNYTDSPIDLPGTLSPVTDLLIKTNNNYLLVSFLDVLVPYMRIQRSEMQVRTYNLLQDLFPVPQEGIESSAVYCFFIETIAESSYSILASGVFNLIELASFGHVVPYIKCAFSHFCSIYHVTDIKVLFKAFKLELFKYWNSYNMEVNDFPYTLFGYADLIDFMLDNYKELIALKFSVNSGHWEGIVDLAAHFQGSEKADVIVDSFSAIIPLAYTEKTMRRNIFSAVKKEFNSDSAFSEQLRNKAALIVYNLLALSDFSQAELLVQALKKIPNSKSYRDIFKCGLEDDFVKPQVSIPVSVTYDAISDVLGKAFGAKGSFWVLPNLHFMIKRFLVQLTESIGVSARVSKLRGIKFLLCLPNVNIANEELITMLVRELSRHLTDIEVAPDVCSIIVHLWTVHPTLHHNVVYVPSFITVISQAIASKERLRANSTAVVREKVSEFIRDKDATEPHRAILEASLKIMAGEQVKVNVAEIEKVLQLEDFQSDYDNCSSLFSLISSIFEHCPALQGQALVSETSDSAARKLLIHSENLSKSFMLWKARYLGTHYAETGKTSTVNKADTTDLLLKTYELEFEMNISMVDNIFLKILRYETTDVSISSCIDYILGVVIWRNENRTADKTVISYNKYFQICEHRLMMMDIHTCILLVQDTENARRIFHTKDLKHTIDNVESLIASEESDFWMSILTIAIVNDLASVTGLVPLISTFISKVPRFSKSIFNDLVMFYIYASKHGASQIGRLIKKFYGIARESIPSDCKKVFIELILLLRIGEKKGRKEFATVFRNVELPLVYNDALSIGMVKSSLMLMEHFYSNLSEDFKLKWQDERSFLSTAYNLLDDSFDLIYGMPVEPTLKYGMTLLGRSNENNWRSISLESGLLDTSLMIGQASSNVSKMINSTLSVGLNGLSKVLVESSDSPSGSQINDQSFEWAWKLNQWNIPVSRGKKVSKTENEIIYKTLKLIHDTPRDYLSICEESLHEAIRNQAQFFHHSDGKSEAENTKSWLRALGTLKSVEDILKCDNHDLQLLIEGNMRAQSWYGHSDFESYENILLGRIATFGLSAEALVPFSKLRTEDSWVSVLYELDRYGQFARKNHEGQKSINASIYFNHLVESKFANCDDGLKEFVSKCAKFQLASMFWDQGETGFPVSTLKDIIKRDRIYQMVKTTDDNNFTERAPYSKMQLSNSYISALIVKWSSESRQETSSSIMDTYLEVIATESIHSGERQAEIYHHFATFCANYIKDQVSNKEIIKYSKQIITKENELAKLKEFKDDRRNSKEDRDAAKSKYARIYRIRAQDKEELNRLKNNRNRFVQNAVTFYLRCIAITDDFDDIDVDRFCGIWLEYSRSDEVNDIVKQALFSISHHKFLTWVSQLTSRLAHEVNNFQYVLSKLLESLTLCHPYHTAYLIKSLRLHLSIQNNDHMVESRALAADKVWRKLATKNEVFNSTILAPIDKLCDEASDLANERFERASKVKLSALKSGKFWLQVLPTYMLPPPTREIPINKGADYRDVPRIIATETSMSVATSGISLPKIMTFKLSNGEHHKMLLKGGSDDLRQDAIMEQVFEKVNKIFQNYRETRVRNLRIRTYKVVPLGPQAGVIEFVRNSVALNDILRPLHEKQDRLKLDGARSLMKKVQKASLDVRIKAYYSVMEKVKPVMRMYFFDNFLRAEEWFESKITYTRGISTTSFVGYILGLGDRHSNNILLDNSTGEPIHIDLGVAFDQGKRLPIPETVPFRLTRDIVDGFGITGVDGCFIKSSEHVLRVLRLETERIMDILNILKYDPLYSWTLSPIRKQKLQEQGDMITVEDIEATDAIEGVRNKLVSNDLSIEATVRELTQEAMDPDRLACIYMGWSPFY